MDKDQIAKEISRNYDVPCIYLGNGSFIFNPPFRVEGEELRKLRNDIATTIAELANKTEDE